MGNEPTLAEALAAAGFGYRRCQIEGQQEVFSLENGAVVDKFYAHEAWEWLETRFSQTAASATSRPAETATQMALAL